MLFQTLSLSTIILAPIFFLVTCKTIFHIHNEIKIRRLGGHARSISTWFPFDIDMIIRAVRATIRHQNLTHWTSWFTSFPTPRYTVEASPAGRRCVFTADPENIKAILATQFTDYGKGAPFHREWSDFLGDSIFTTDLDAWHSSRQLIRPQFIKDRVSDLEVFEEHVQILIRKINEGGMGQGREIDVSDLFFRYTLDAATHFLLGSSSHSLELPEQEFARAFGEVQRVQNIIARAGHVIPSPFLNPGRSMTRTND